MELEQIVAHSNGNQISVWTLEVHVMNRVESFINIVGFIALVIHNATPAPHTHTYTHARTHKHTPTHTSH